MRRLIARPTIYRGIAMRSRLEATFAANLDRARLDWEYEPRAYGDETGQYLPDFEIPHAGFRWFIDVKPWQCDDDPPERWDDDFWDQVFALGERMAIIRSSVPDAVLAVACPGVGDELLTLVTLDMGPLWFPVHGKINDPEDSMPLRVDWDAWRP